MATTTTATPTTTTTTTILDCNDYDAYDGYEDYCCYDYFDDKTTTGSTVAAALRIAMRHDTTLTLLVFGLKRR